jgi:uncharacterized membrane protein (DUF485 family)
MTTKQVARKFHMGWPKLEYFIEMLVAYFQVRLAIAYHKGWMACAHGIPIDKHIGTQIPW